MRRAPARDTLTVYGGSDYAVTADGGDYTVHIVVGIDAEGGFGCSTCGGRKPVRIAGSRPSAIWSAMEADGLGGRVGQIKAGVGPFLEKRMRERKAFVARDTSRPAATRRCGRNRSAAAWRSMGSTCRSMRRGMRRSVGAADVPDGPQ
jgi:hypothetical protein